MDFLKSQFDKLLLTSLFLTVYFAPYHKSLDDWEKHIVDLVLGAIIGLSTGRLLQRKTDKNGNGTQNIT